MPEAWDEVVTAQKEQESCNGDVQTIKNACVKEHGKEHVAECQDCWNRVINRMRDRYLNSATKEWFSGRRLFLQDLDSLFAQAREHKIDFKAIEQRIGQEKNDWYRDKVKNLNLPAAVKTPAEASKLQRKLNDRSIPTEQLAAELRQAFSDGLVSNEAAFNSFLDRLKAAKTQEARNALYMDVFFQPGHDPAGAAKSQKYIEMVQTGKPITDVVNVMLRDRQSVKGIQSERQNLLNKLDELRRAKAAHEQEKAKQAKIRQDKADAAAAAEEGPSFPPCAVCAKDVSNTSLIVCPHCHLMAELFRVQDETVVYCSDECADSTRGLQSHSRDAHICMSGQDCRNLQNDDVDMDDGEDGDPVYCRECVTDLEVPAIFCDAKCYDANFQRHREDVHLPEREKLHRGFDDERELEFAADDRSRYRARKIEDHFITQNEAFREYEQKTGAVSK